MYNSIILSLAKEDIREASNWYNKKSKGLGNRFTAEVREKVHFIRQNPTASNVRYDDVRTAVLNIFPYMIHYTIDDPTKQLLFRPCYIQVVIRNCGKRDKQNPDSGRVGIITHLVYIIGLKYAYFAINAFFTAFKYPYPYFVQG